MIAAVDLIFLPSMRKRNAVFFNYEKITAEIIDGVALVKVYGRLKLNFSGIEIATLSSCSHINFHQDDKFGGSYEDRLSKKKSCQHKKAKACHKP